MMSRNRNRTQTLQAMPREHLSWRVIAYLDANRGEMLTRHDVAVKFDTDASTVDNQLQPGLTAGLLRVEHGTSNGTVWSRPPKLGNLPPIFAPSVAKAARTINAAQAAERRADYEAIVIEHGIPVSDQAKTGGHWKALFDRMGPGDSFKVPNRISPALSHAKLKYCKAVATARFVVRKVDDEQTRIWRTA